MEALQSGRSGQILMLATIAIAVLLGFSALAVDVGLLYSTRRRLQTAADAAAIAGATALRDGQDYSKAAEDVTSFNGFTNSQNNVTTIVSEPTLPSRLSERRHLRLNGHLADRPDLFSARAGLQIHETGRSGGGAG